MKLHIAIRSNAMKGFAQTNGCKLLAYLAGFAQQDVLVECTECIASYATELFRKSNYVRKISGNPKIDRWSEQWEALCKERWTQKRLSRTYKDNPGIWNSTWQIHEEATRDEVQFLRFFDSMVDLDKFRGQGKALGQNLCNFPKYANVECAILEHLKGHFHMRAEIKNPYQNVQNRAFLCKSCANCTICRAPGTAQLLRPAPFHGSIIGFRNRHIPPSLHLPFAMPAREDLKALGPRGFRSSQFCAAKNSSIIEQRGIISRSRRSQPEPILQYQPVSQDYHRCFQVPRKPTTNAIPAAAGPRIPKAVQKGSYKTNIVCIYRKIEPEECSARRPS